MDDTIQIIGIENIPIGRVAKLAGPIDPYMYESIQMRLSEFGLIVTNNCLWNR